jgi:predicted phage baseplate assembly protein
VIGADGKEEVKEISVVRGNVVLADHGYTFTTELQLPAGEPGKGYYSLRLPHKDVSFGVPYHHEMTIHKPAAPLLHQDPRQALPSRMRLIDADETWTVQRDLLGSDRFKADFVVEIEQDGTSNLRFGDGVMGKKPSAVTEFTARYRIGNGRAGNVGAGAITRIVSDFQGIQKVRNPLAAMGGKDPETMEQVRQFAPHAFRTQERAVTEADYAEVTQRHPEVQKAAATFRWTGSWYTVFVTVDRKGGWEVDTEFKARIRRHLEQYRLAGYDIEIDGPVFVPLDILIMVCVKNGYFGGEVKQSLLKVFSRYDFADGRQGFFHPDNFTFGQPVYLSQIYQAAMEVAGVASVEVLKFQRWGKTPMNEKKKGFLKPETLEVIRLDNDPNFPENGKIDFEMHGGL